MPSALYIFWILHQTTTRPRYTQKAICCISFESYIKPQHALLRLLQEKGCISFESYIKPQHAQGHIWRADGCISFESYIKPQQCTPFSWHRACCISFESYIKPQQSPLRENRECVVYLLNPTSNHNNSLNINYMGSLYIFWILHQTTTKRLVSL